jgi:hypothetical protein
MLALTRRKYPERPDCWQIYYGDVCVGSIARRSGCPVDEPQTLICSHKKQKAAAMSVLRLDM